jgi:hypothetical protein
LSNDAGQRWASIAVGVTVLFVVGWMTYEAMTTPPARRTHDAGPAASATTAAPPEPEEPPDTGAADDFDGPFREPLSLGDAESLPANAPRSVKLGVVLVTFKGAEGAPPNARSKREAYALAERLGQEARTDFHRAVMGGDPGSADDIGRLPRGVLDSRTELAVFALANGEVSEVLETPRGFWIVKRLE